MKKTLLIALAALMVILTVSCATTKGADIPDVVVIYDTAEYAAEPMEADAIWTALTKYMDEDDLAEDVIVDDASMTITFKNITLGSNVGMLAQEGEVVVDAKLHVVDSKVEIIVSFVDAYTFYQLGPVTKKVSTGLTGLGMKEYEFQTEALTNAFTGLCNQSIYLYGVNEGWYGEELQKAYQEA